MSVASAREMDIGSLLRRAVRHHESGRTELAEPLYRNVIERDPRQADAWHLLGRVAMERGDWRAAAALVLEAIRLCPLTPAFQTTLGEVLAAQGRPRDAALCYHEALRLEPGFTPALVNLGNALQTDGKYAEACAAYGRALEVRPDSGAVLSNLGNALRALGYLDDALACHREAYRLEPRNPDVSVNLSAACLQQGKYGEAAEWARRALAVRPRLGAALSNLSVALLNLGQLGDSEHAACEALALEPECAHLHSNLGSVLLQRKRFAEAEESCRRALELRPDYPEAITNLAVALQFQDRLEEAAEQAETASRALPEFAEAWTNLGTVRQQQGRHREALACFDRALARRPEFAKARFCRALSLLTTGSFAAGWQEYEWRWKVVGSEPRACSQPCWDGSPLEGRTILLYAEQGLGDTIQFARYVPLVAAAGGRVVVECQSRVAPLVAAIPGVDGVVTPTDPLPPFDVQAALMSLPRIFGTTLETIPAETPYLRADSRSMGNRLPPRTAGIRRIGIAWSGNPEHAANRRRSLPLDALDSLRELPEVEWYSLHAGVEARQEAEASGWIRHVLTDDGGLPELAALIGALDLVVTVDTMAAHLAGALDCTVWTLLAASADWRWLEGREDSPWYPTMRLFRQARAGAWIPVVERIAGRIRALPVKPLAEGTEEIHETGKRSGNRPDRERQDVELQNRM